MSQELVVDAAGPGTIDYMIQSGDTLGEIAQSNGTSVQAIMEINPDITDPDTIFPDTSIRIPDQDAAPTNDEPTTLASPVLTSTLTTRM